MTEEQTPKTEKTTGAFQDDKFRLARHITRELADSKTPKWRIINDHVDEFVQSVNDALAMTGHEGAVNQEKLDDTASLITITQIRKVDHSL